MAVFCPKCGAQNEDYAQTCSQCQAALPQIGAAYRDIMGRHYPAMALVEVKGLVEPEARLEIEATAVIPDWAIDPALFPSDS